MKDFIVILLLLTFQVTGYSQSAGKTFKATESVSFYKIKPEDPEAVYFTEEQFKIKADGKMEVSDALQEAINSLKTIRNSGIIFIPEGTYLISKTIYIPTAIKLIGYGNRRPLFVLGKNTPGFQKENTDDKGKANYMFWFTFSIKKDGEAVHDAGASTFYSSISNIDFRIEDGNPFAVALRTHFAQHSFIEHVDIHVGNGKAGIFDAGNEMEDVRFFGGEYGILTTKPSPGWQFMMVDTYFEGQRKAAIKSREGGLTIIRMTVKNVPTVIEVFENFYEKLFIEDSRFENISGPALIISDENNAYTQISLRNVSCSKVPVLVSYPHSKNSISGEGNIYRIKNFNHGLQIADLGKKPEFGTIREFETLKSLPVPVKKDIPDFPDMKSWVNLKSLGAKGDGITDDTKAIQDAIDKNPNIYVPQGWYRVTETIKLKPNSVLIGLSPIATQFILQDNTEAFGSFGGPKPLLESSEGGFNILTGIGLSTGALNPRAVGCKWMANANSYVNDVKFLGGHGTIERPNSIWNKSSSYSDEQSAWDSQYWSLWITNGGGGTFKNIWSASTFATSGAYISNTATPGRVYALSVEHHVRNEVRFKNVSNWKVYALQLEEESKESSDCQPLEIENCENMVFANLYMFRVIRVNTPAAYSVRSWGNKNVEFLNVHHYSQTKYTSTIPLYDINSDIEVRPWEFNRLLISGNLPRQKESVDSIGKIRQLVKGFEFADGICHDSKGNIYFSESRMRRIYKWSVETKSLSLIADFPWEPLSLACDTKDNLLVVFKYIPRPGYLIAGEPEVFPVMPDAAGTSYSGWGNSGFGTLVYSMDPKNPEETIQLLKKIPVENIKNIRKTLNPSNRRRDSGDFNKVSTNHFKEAFVAPDGVIIIPVVYDLARSNSLVEGYPGKEIYATDEYIKRTVKLTVGQEGYLSNPQIFAERGEFCSAVDQDGNVYIADGQIYIYNKEGKLIGEIEVPERPATLTFGGENKNTLFITGRSAFYQVKIK
ncbi:glycosyl hydrolase family 28-related protein [Dyadobacter subterraneus]|uniref:SMP-30/gluconolactonase/LRE family protein n=1 Tax=Dyadobacter subterraneus TaxID=2773304 RepID=A0ABR9WG37_9BACT|nr:glycosyl hydrolase family 28-related protein [Dyadobacter subterraneus]MBE9464387.1 SMP-30/gluconolactonase/LRE family protein [Dyadobacter subterraneus]